MFALSLEGRLRVCGFPSVQQYNPVIPTGEPRLMRLVAEGSLFALVVTGPLDSLFSANPRVLCVFCVILLFFSLRKTPRRNQSSNDYGSCSALFTAHVTLTVLSGDSMSFHRRTPAPLYNVLFLLVCTFLLPRSLSAQQLSPELLHGLQWRLIGPHRGGRVTAVSGIAGDPKTYYMGTPGGGVWKTTNAGRTWLPIFDAAHVASIGDLAVAPSNPNVIYVATGEQTPGNGVWKSTDAGATWSHVGLQDSKYTLSIIVDPRDANLVYAAATGSYAVPLGDPVRSEARGIYKSTDGGATWRKVYYKDDHWSPYELDFDPNDFHTIVAAVTRIPTQPGERPAEGVDTILLKSTDSGEHWTPMGDQGLPTDNRHRTGLSIAPGLGGKRIFALMSQGLYRSDDAGATWQKITNDPRILGSDYFGRVYSDPKNPDVVYVMQTSTYRSGDGGRTFTAWKGTPSGEDDHVLWIAPEDPNRIFMGTDQGAVITYDCGTTWSSWFNQPTGQFYRVATDNTFPYRLYAAQQDSGSIVVPTRSDFGQITYRDWFSSGSFESSFIAPDPLNPDHVYSLGWYGNIIRLDRNTGQTATVFMSPSNYRESWETPLTFSLHDPHTLFFGAQFLLKTSDGGLTWKEISPDLTKPAEAVAPSTPPKAAAGEGGHIPSKDDLEFSPLFSDADEEQAQAAARGFIQTIAPSPLDANLIWVGTSNGMIQLTRDSATWTNVSPSGLPEHTIINSVEASPHDPNVAFAAAITRHDAHPLFFRTRDAGKTWEKIVTGLPDAGIAHTIREDTLRKGMLFAGTETGIYISFDSGDHWQPLQLNLPTASMRDLAIHDDDLIAATFGRGLWVLDDISPLRQFPDNLQKSPVHFFTPQTATRAHWDNHPDTPLQRDYPASSNPPDGAILYYFLSAPPKGEITLDIFDEKGTRLDRISSVARNASLPPANVPEYWFAPPSTLPTTSGINRFVWDLRLPHPNALPYGFFGEKLEYTEYTLPDHAVPGETPRFQPTGPTVPPGTYELVLTVDGKPYRQKLRLVADPRVHMSQADFDTQFDLSRRIWDLMNNSASSYSALGPLETQLAERRKSLSANSPKELSDSIAEAQKQLDALQTGSEAEPGFGTLNRNLGRYLEMLEVGDIVPNDSVRTAYRTSCEAYAKDAVAANKLAADTIPGLSKQLATEKLAPVTFTAPQSPTPSCAP
jgi:photosystem II stability/assembly factor-like uncharacterized protein